LRASLLYISGEHEHAVVVGYGLFRKVWAKQLATTVTEAIADAAEASPDAPSVDAVEAFLTAAHGGKAQQRKTAGGMRQETREGDGVVYSEVHTPGGVWVHKSYLAR
jgi:hypothetical protein